ncbi:MAG TPA: RidA family protein [Myxococcota bacterium]|nr:RidA family protein [Myxococcota bacterium]
MSESPPRTVVSGLGRLPVFSHASTAGGLIFVSGTLGTEGDGFTLVPGGAGPETRQTLENIGKILAAEGATLADVVKVSVYVADMADFAAMNEAYAKFFPADPPARITVGGAQLALGARVEIECVARAPGDA